MIEEYIKEHLHELSEYRPIIMYVKGVAITVEDFDHVANGSTLGEVLADSALTAQVITDLTMIALARQDPA